MAANAIGLKYAVEQLAGDVLRVSYRVINGSDRSLFLTTPLVSIEESAVTPSAEGVYAYLDPEGILHLTRRVWPVPDDVDIYLPEVPRLTEVRTGASFEEQLTCALPVELRYPYRFAGQEEPATPPEVLTGEAYGLAFSMGYLMEARDGEDGFCRSMATVGDGEERRHLVVSYAVATAHQQLVQGAVVAMRVGVRDVNR